MFVLGTMNLIDCINFNLLMPYVDRMVSDFLHSTPDDPDVVKTVGMLIGLYSICEVLFSPFWGTLADRIGRRPTLLIGLAGSAVAPIIFGMATSLPMAVAARALDGIFCGNVGVTKTYLGDIVDRTNEARGFSMLAVCFSMGLVLGPVLGGQLVFPASWAPGLFGGTIFDRHPYLLPNLLYAIVAILAWFVGFFCLKESLPRSIREQRRLARTTARQAAQEQPSTALLNGADAIGQAPAGRCAAFFKSKSLIKVLFAYCFLSGYFGSWIQVFILLVSLPRNIGGMALAPHEIGLLQNFAGVGLLLTQLILYPRLTKMFGFFKCFAVGLMIVVSVTVLFPVYGLFADPNRFGDWRYLPLAFMMFMGTGASGFCFPTLFVWLNRAADGLDRGMVNGVAHGGGALFRSITPPLSSVFLSLGLEMPETGFARYLPVFVNTTFCIMCICLVRSAGMNDSEQAPQNGQARDVQPQGVDKARVDSQPADTAVAA